MQQWPTTSSRTQARRCHRVYREYRHPFGEYCKSCDRGTQRQLAQLVGHGVEVSLGTRDRDEFQQWLQKQLQDKLGTLTELFGHLTSASGDLASNLEVSLASAQYPDREVFLRELVTKMSGSDALPSIEEIERVWYELQREMVESGKVTAFNAEVTKPNGDKVEQKVVRVGTFNVVSDEGKYLQYVPEKDTLEELARQPTGPYIGWAKNLAAASEGIHRFGVDPTGPTGGSYLAALINSPSIEERWHQGGYVGYLVRSKPPQAREGGVHSGSGVLDSLVLRD